MRLDRSAEIGAEEDDRERLDEDKSSIRPRLFSPLLPSTGLKTYNTRIPDMSTVQTWTLWQRMPPRYQLTTKALVDDPDELVAVGNAPERSTLTPRKSSSPRPFSAGNTSPPLSARKISQRENFMLSNNPPDKEQSDVKELIISQPKGAQFPKRNSDYINTFQKQMRVNSARRRLAEVPPTPNRKSTQAPPSAQNSYRAKTAPVFPVTSTDAHVNSSRKSRLSDNGIINDPVSNGKAGTPQKPKLVGEGSKMDTFHFEDAKSTVSSSCSSMQLKSRDSEPKAKKYVVQDTNRATVYIDNGKVMYFGKSRHDLTQLLKTQSLKGNRGSCFLAELRRDYLKHPKFDRTGTGHLSRSENDPRRIANERVDYNRRVEHILSYYDENQPDSRLSFVRPTSGSRSKIGSRIKGLSLLATTPGTRSPSRASTPEPVDNLCGDFIRFNKQAKMHKRQFYLRTPGLQHKATIAEMEKCRCSMCRMELQLALVTGNHQDINLAMVAAANEAGIQGKAINVPRGNDSKMVISEAAVPRKPGPRQNTQQKVTFQNAEEKETGSETTKVRINCKLPDVTDLAVSESGFESARTQDALSTCADDITDVGK